MIKCQLPHTRFDQISDNKHDIYLYEKLFTKLLAQAVNKNTKFMFKKTGRFVFFLNPLSAKFIKRSNTLKQFVGKLPTNCLSVFDHFVGLALKGLSMFLEGTVRKNSKQR